MPRVEPTNARIIELLVERAAISLGARTDTKYELLSHAAQILFPRPEFSVASSRSFLGSVLARERTSPTNFLPSFAVPHVVLDDLVASRSAWIVPVNPIEFRNSDSAAEESVSGDVRVVLALAIAPNAREVALGSIGAMALSVSPGLIQDLCHVSSETRFAELLRHALAESFKAPGSIRVAQTKGDFVGKATMVNRLGLHARPAMALAGLSHQFDANVVLVDGQGREADIKSIMEIMLLAPSRGDVVTVRARGPQAADAIAAILELIRSGFGED